MVGEVHESCRTPEGFNEELTEIVVGAKIQEVKIMWAAYPGNYKCKKDKLLKSVLIPKMFRLIFLEIEK